MSGGAERPHLIHLDFAGFRNFLTVELDLVQPWVGVVGPNGAGKTNLLEAIHVLCRQRGFRDEPPAKLAAWDAEQLTIRGRFAAGDDIRTRILAWDAKQGITRSLDGDAVDSARTWAVGEPIFGYRPDDDLFFHDEPRQRRKYLDWFCAYREPSYMDAVAAYDRALKQRNALLRMGGQGEEWDAWDAELAATGARLTALRAAAAAVLADAYDDVWRDHDRAATLRYRAGGSTDAEAARARYAETRAADRERGWTAFGPHRDDLIVQLGERPIREAGSQGYRKLGVLLLALACARATPHTRLFYLDDFEGELDRDNEAYVYDLLRAQPIQVWISGVRQPKPLVDDVSVAWIPLDAVPTRTLKLKA